MTDTDRQGLTEAERDVVIEAAHPSRPDREELLTAAVERILSDHLAADRPWADCTGAGDCPEPWHVHGCYADDGQCDDPKDHHENRAEWESDRLAPLHALADAADSAAHRDGDSYGAVVGTDALRAALGGDPR